MNRFTQQSLRFDGALGDPDFRPARAHIETARNTLSDAGTLHDQMLAAIDAAINWYAPLNDDLPFPLQALADAAAAARHADSSRRGPNMTEEPPLELGPVHKKLLNRGRGGRWIGLDDDMALRTGQVCALGELERAGLVKEAEGPFPPGPPSMKPRVLTEAGKKVLDQLSD